MRSSLRKNIVCILALLTICANGWGQTNVIYPSSTSDIDIRHKDLIELLTVALEKSVVEYGDFTVAPSKLKMNEARSLAELQSNDSVNVVWSPSSEDLEQRFIPIRVPLRKDLLGLRIALIDTKNQAALANVKSLSDLQKLSVGMGIGWVDVAVLDANQINVVTANYDALFAMAANDRFDLFLRGINEVFNEYDQRKATYPNLSVEKHLLIYYPWPYYFFVNKNNQRLASRIKLGLERMIDDGSFDRIFMKYNGDAIRRADISHRRIIQLDNPLLPSQTPMDSRYWVYPSLIKSVGVKRVERK